MRRDVERAMALARTMIFLVAVVVPLVVGFLAMAAPGGPSPMVDPAPWVVRALPLVGVVGYLVGLGWMVRIYRSRPETSRSDWRSRGRSPVPVPRWSRNGQGPATSDAALMSVRPSMRDDVQRARALARALIMLALVLGGLVLFVWFAAPGPRGGMFYEPSWRELAVPWLGWAAYLVGLGWMVRIYRSRPETSKADWRYRSDR
jgi:hypothetical protein